MDTTIPSPLLASHINDICQETKTLLTICDHLDAIEMSYFASEIGEVTANILATLTNLAEYMPKPPAEGQPHE